MSERAELVAWIRGELVGPSRPLEPPTVIGFDGAEFPDLDPQRRGPLGWAPIPDGKIEEILYYEHETPHRKYGAGLLHPVEVSSDTGPPPDQVAAEAADTLGGVEFQERDAPDAGPPDGADESEIGDASVTVDPSDDFEVTSSDIRRPSTVGISFCVRLEANGRVLVRLPQGRRFAWQDAGSPEFPLNGRYELCARSWMDRDGAPRNSPMWRRRAAVLPGTEIGITRGELVPGQPIRRDVPLPDDSPMALRVDVFPRPIMRNENIWLLTVVLRNSTSVPAGRVPREAIFYQTYFEVLVEDGRFERYPESQRPFSQLDPEEQSLVLLYREAATWGIGHGCAAGWDAGPGETPWLIYADVMPAVEIPSMNPDIRDRWGEPIRLSMKSLAALSDEGQDSSWQSLAELTREYGDWVQRRHAELSALPAHLQAVANRHLEECRACLNRIQTGISLLKTDERVRRAFRLANLAMLLQQIITKQLAKRPLEWSKTARLVVPAGDHRSPLEIYEKDAIIENVGSWRAFQAAFLLMSLPGISDENSRDREIVDVIWFPTGGGKTEAYLGVIAFHLFYQRLLMTGDEKPRRDGTNVLMRYTLRMLTTQQFQRAASLLCSMEVLRRNPASHGMGNIPGRRFSIGLWIGGDAAPNKIVDAQRELREFRSGRMPGNPLVLTECPWCRAAIGRCGGLKPVVTPKLTDGQWNAARTRGITDRHKDGPLLHCPDQACAFGSERWEEWLPVEVIDERIYRNPPSLVIGTADKLAMMAYRPEAGAIFGGTMAGGERLQLHVPPGLIIQDELHLISGPLGTMYGLYEGIFERLCSRRLGGRWIKPKLIASTATIRGADEQVRALYARTETKLFPSPGLLMGDSFFGVYARDENGDLSRGRLYLGIHAPDHGSILTTQVRAFASSLFRPASFPPDRRDAWWSLLVFYNSIRELSGARTLFDSDIPSRLKYLFNRENNPPEARRDLRIVEELTSRLSQAEIVGMLDRLASTYAEARGGDVRLLDACLASNIIEVGVDIDRLSLMGVVGQPKTTAQYIQVTGRVGRRWWERPGLILMIYNPSKSRDRSHFEQFHAYHRRLYERVEPTSATPFALSAIQRALPGALLVWARQQCDGRVHDFAAYEAAIAEGSELLRQRCEAVQVLEDVDRSLEELEAVRGELERKWRQNPQAWEEFPPRISGEYLMLWPGQFATRVQKDRGMVVPSSMRQVDGSAELNITQGYALMNPPTNH